MRVVYTVPSPGFSYFIPRTKSVPDDSCVYRVVGSSEIANGAEDWEIPGYPVYDVEAMYLLPLDGGDLTARAVALLAPVSSGSRYLFLAKCLELWYVFNLSVTFNIHQIYDIVLSDGH